MIITAILLLIGCTDNLEMNEHEGKNDSPQDNAEKISKGIEGFEDLIEDDDETSEQIDESNDDPVEEPEDENVAIDLEDDLFNPYSVKSLVNKQYALPEDYIPDDLVTVEVPTVLENPEVRQLREPAANALKIMFDKAREDGIYLHARSGYRSYQTQAYLFNTHVENHGEEAANRFSARPGESEHQTGLAMDVTSESVNLQLTTSFGETTEGLWVRDHAHKYGFIIRFPEGKEAITGYQYEPWHLRYLGEALATEVYESGLTYEEYLVERGFDIEI